MPACVTQVVFIANYSDIRKIFSDILDRSIGRTVVHIGQLKIPVSLRLYRLYSGTQKILMIPTQKVDADFYQVSQC